VEKLIKSIKDEIDKNTSYEIPYLDEIGFFKQFLSNYDIKDIHSLCNLKLEEFLTAVLIVNGIDMPIDDILYHSSNVVHIFGLELDSAVIYGYFQLTQKFRQNGILEPLHQIQDKYGYLKDNFKSKKFVKELKKYIEETNNYDLEEELSIYLDYELRLFSTIQYEDMPFQIYSDKRDSFLALFNASKNIDAFDSIFDFIIWQTIFSNEDFKSYLNFFNKKGQARLEKSIFKDINGTNQHKTLQDLNNIVNYYNNLIERKRKEEKEISKNIQRCKELLLTLSNLNDECPIVLNERMLKLCINSEIKLNLLKFINEFNLSFYKKNAEIHEKNHNSSYNKLELIFTKNNFSFKKLSLKNQENLIEKADINKVEEILSFLNNYNFEFITEKTSIFIDVLLYSDVHILSNIKGLVLNEVINNKFVQHFPTILISEELGSDYKELFSYEKFTQKMLLLTSRNINVSLLVSNDFKIFENSIEQLSLQLDIIDKYGINLADDNRVFEILRDSSLLDLIDNFIELGL